jgi:hypothetical protein
MTGRGQRDVEKKTITLYNTGKNYSIDGCWILTVKILNWRELRAKDAVAWGCRSDDRINFFVEN